MYDQKFHQCTNERCNTGALSVILAPRLGTFKKIKTNSRRTREVRHADYYTQGREASAVADWNYRKRHQAKGKQCFYTQAGVGVEITSLGEQLPSQVDWNKMYC